MSRLNVVIGGSRATNYIFDHYRWDLAGTTIKISGSTMFANLGSQAGGISAFPFGAPQAATSLGSTGWDFSPTPDGSASLTNDGRNVYEYSLSSGDLVLRVDDGDIWWGVTSVTVDPSSSRVFGVTTNGAVHTSWICRWWWVMGWAGWESRVRGWIRGSVAGATSWPLMWTAPPRNRGDPADTGSGNWHEAFDDFSIPGPKGGGLSWSRLPINSIEASVDGPLGLWLGLWCGYTSLGSRLG